MGPNWRYRAVAEMCVERFFSGPSRIGDVEGLCDLLGPSFISIRIKAQAPEPQPLYGFGVVNRRL